MKKNKHKIHIIFLILLSVLIASNYITYYVIGESLIDILFEEEQSVNRHWIVKKAQPDGRTCTIDGYEITLAKHAFCPDTNEGYCEFVVKNKQTNLKKEHFPQYPIMYGFGKNARFTLNLEAEPYLGSTVYDGYTKVKKNILYIYYYFSTEYYSKEMNVNICDVKNGDLDKDMFPIKYSAKFPLTNIVPAPEY